MRHDNIGSKDERVGSFHIRSHVTIGIGICDYYSLVLSASKDRSTKRETTTNQLLSRATRKENSI